MTSLALRQWCFISYSGESSELSLSSIFYDDNQSRDLLSMITLEMEVTTCCKQILSLRPQNTDIWMNGECIWLTIIEPRV